MARTGRVDLQFVDAVGVVLADVAAQLDRVGRAGHVLQFPVVAGPALLDVRRVLQTLQVLVRLAVQLEIGFERRLVGAQPAQVVAANQEQSLVLPLPRTVRRDVLGNRFGNVAAKHAAHQTLEHVRRIGIHRLRKRLHRFRV